MILFRHTITHEQNIISTNLRLHTNLLLKYPGPNLGFSEKLS
jgi:hypothetical protein